MLKNAVLDAKIHEHFAKIWRNFDKILLKIFTLRRPEAQGGGEPSAGGTALSSPEGGSEGARYAAAATLIPRRCPKRRW